MRKISPERCHHQQGQVIPYELLQIQGGWPDAAEMNGGRGQRAFLGRLAHRDLDLACALHTVAAPFVPVAVDQQIGGVPVAGHQLVECGAQPRIGQRSLRHVETARGAAAELGVDFGQVVGELAHLRAQR